jgi:hypothetical protein
MLIRVRLPFFKVQMRTEAAVHGKPRSVGLSSLRQPPRGGNRPNESFAYLLRMLLKTVRGRHLGSAFESVFYSPLATGRLA